MVMNRFDGMYQAYTIAGYITNTIRFTFSNSHPSFRVRNGWVMLVEIKMETVGLAKRFFQ